MAFDAQSTTGVTQAAAFIPEIWGNEMLVARENNIVAGKLMKKISHLGKPGDTIHMPSITNLTANDKAAGAGVTLQQVTESDTAILLDKHKEVSQLFEDIALVQSQYHYVA